MCDTDINDFCDYIKKGGYKLQDILRFHREVKNFSFDIGAHLEEEGKITVLCDSVRYKSSKIRQDFLEDEKLCNFLGLCDKIYDINRDVGEYAWITSKKPGESTNLTDFFPEWTDVDVSFDRRGHYQEETLNKKRAEYKKSLGLPYEDEE